jgi:sortase (surface protein transpeptidase)
MRHQPRAAALAVLLALSGGTLTTLRMRAPAPPASPPVEPAATVPVRLDIPRIGLHTRLVRLGLDRDGTLRLPAPDRDSPAGWYERSPVPGDAGAAVLIGHVDPARDGPTVFHRLGALRPGDAVSVRRSDGVTVRFRVTGRHLHRTSLDVHRTTGTPSLQLVTCGGDFEPGRRRHRSNLVVSATAI